MRGDINMREEIKDFELDEVVGGVVNLSQAANKIGFTTLHEGYVLKCSYQDAKKLVSKLFAENELSESAFDKLVKDEFLKRGWI